MANDKLPTTPKERFIASKFKVGHEAWASTEAALAACDAALVTMIDGTPNAADVSQSWDQAQRIRGARQFSRILLSLHLPDEPAEYRPVAGARLKPPQ